ncbi:DUF2062 domain-containing protein [Luteolibacter luteus]|uniref:DUF2062 domain-containing protein n=1 Tax=Luteolibacter luteus TaxID=2728835 RepID=A0A858RGH7_9BACT|nr:DUF2062 domain-containing protein [Luteolibacter luteus]QJE96256.1 DUF2062 domain-containing protein [Luteolibacter luteus]
MIGKIYRWGHGKVAGLSKLEDRPKAIALGIASGVFFGFIPLVGFKTLLAIGTAKLARGNMIAAAVAVTLHDVLLPLAPFVLRWEYQLGYWLMSHPHHLPPNLHAVHHGPMMWFHWATLFTVGLPLLIGSIVIAIPFTLGSYFLALWLLERSSAARLAVSAREGGGFRDPSPPTSSGSSHSLRDRRPSAPPDPPEDS